MRVYVFIYWIKQWLSLFPLLRSPLHAMTWLEAAEVCDNCYNVWWAGNFLTVLVGDVITCAVHGSFAMSFSFCSPLLAQSIFFEWKAQRCTSRTWRTMSCGWTWSTPAARLVWKLFSIDRLRSVGTQFKHVKFMISMIFLVINPSKSCFPNGDSKKK